MTTESAPGPRRSDGRRNRELLLAAAREVIARDGAEASLEQIARAAGVGSATLHRNFPSRRALLEAVFHADVVQLCSHGDDLTDDPDPAGALVAWLEMLAAHTASTRGLATALLSGPGGGLAEEDTCHGLVGATTAHLLERASTADAVAEDVTSDDLITLANALALATEGEPDSARRLLRLSLRGLVRP